MKKDPLVEAFLGRGFDTPWKILVQFQLLFSYPVSRFVFWINGVPWKSNWRLLGVPVILKHRRSSIYIGSGLQLRSTTIANPLGANHPVVLCTWQPGASLAIGDNFGMTGGTICAARSITIGSNVAVGANTTIVDTDFHPLDPAQRRLHPAGAQTAPIVIGDDVFIGMGCLVLKGVTIGRGSVIGAGSVVTRDIPPGVIAAGNPARVIRSI